VTKHLLPRDPASWLIAQPGPSFKSARRAPDGRGVLRARRRLGLEREGDDEAAAAWVRELAARQGADGSFDGSPIATAGVLNLVVDLRVPGSSALTSAAANYLLALLATQPGYGSAGSIAPGSLHTPCDLGGFFGPYEERNRPETMARGAREMNHYRTYEPLLGPQSPVRGERRSSLDRAGPSSCYAWGLVPLSYIIEALCRSGHAEPSSGEAGMLLRSSVGFADDLILAPAVAVLLGAQRAGGGWCRNLDGHPNCTLHAVRALGAHPRLRSSVYAARALAFLRATRPEWAAGMRLFAALDAVAAFDLPEARDLLHDLLAAVVPRQRRDGTFGAPHRVERVAAIVAALRALGASSTAPPFSLN
jgi:hypothetical protein